MTTWKDGGDCGRMYREIVNEDESHIIAEVRIRRSAPYGGTIHSVRPWPEGERNFALVLQAPQMLAALEAIAKGAIVSPEQPPEQIAEQTLRVLRLVREENLEYLKVISAQQRRAERAEAALEAVHHRVEYMLETVPTPLTDWTNWNAVREITSTTIAAVKGEGNETELV